MVIANVPQPAADYASTAILQPDHKILVAGTTANQQSSNVLVAARYNPDGNLDTGFGTKGIVTLPFDGQFSSVGGLVLDSRGRIIVAGSASVGVQVPNQVHTEFAVTRLESNGQIDASFGNAGVQTVNFGGPTEREAGVVIDSQGRIVLAGTSDQNGSFQSDFAVARLTAAGQLDTSFGAGGTQLVDVGGDAVTRGNAVAIDSQQRIVIGGGARLTSSSNESFAVARLDATGALDGAFGAGGKTVIGFTAEFTTVKNMVVDGGNNVLLVANEYSSTSGRASDFAVARFTDQGLLDTAFGVAGHAVIDFQKRNDFAAGIAIDGSGNILLVGYSSANQTFGTNMAVARLTGQGSLDPGFGTGGEETINFGALVNSGNAVLVDSTGRIVLVGDSTQRTSGPDFALAELDTQGNAVASFGNSGKVTTDLGFTTAADVQGTSLTAVQQDGRVVAAGTVVTLGADTDFFVARYNTDGSLDTTFGNHGFLLIDFGGTSDNAAGLAIDGQGRIVVIGNTGPYETVTGLSGFAVARLTPDGQLDASFGNGGEQTGDFGSGYSRASGVAVDSQHRIVIGGTLSSNSTTINVGSFGVARLTDSGQLDSAFGTAGHQIVGFANSIALLTSVAIDAHGRIVLAGGSNPNTSNAHELFAAARLTDTGQLDGSFGAGGEQIVDVSGQSSLANDLAVDSQGRIILAGTSYGPSQPFCCGVMPPPPPSNFSVVRLTDQGVPDATFGNLGQVTLPAIAGYDQATSVALDKAGRIIVVGNARTTLYPYRVVVAALAESGVLDPGFGTGGTQTIDLGTSSQMSGGVAIDSTGGRIMIAGTANVKSAIASLEDSTPLYHVSGALSPESDTGSSQTDGITSDTTPTYAGTATPGATVELLVSTTSSPWVAVGQTTADANGHWQVTSGILADGQYTVWSIPRLPGSTQGPPVFLGDLVIDTVGPTITGIVLDHTTGKILLTMQDSVAGMESSAITKPASYSVTRFLTPNRNERVKNHVTGVWTNSTASPDGSCVVTLQLDQGRKVTHARFLVQVSAAGIVDLAGNHLLGGFTGKFPTGSNQVARNFAARLDYYHHHAFPIRPVKPRYQVMPKSRAKVSLAHTVKVLPSGHPVAANNHRVASQHGAVAIHHVTKK